MENREKNKGRKIFPQFPPPPHRFCSTSNFPGPENINVQHNFFSREKKVILCSLKDRVFQRFPHHQRQHIRLHSALRRSTSLPPLLQCLRVWHISHNTLENQKTINSRKLCRTIRFLKSKDGATEVKWHWKNNIQCRILSVINVTITYYQWLRKGKMEWQQRILSN